MEDWTDALDNNSLVDTVYLDFEKVLKCSSEEIG